MKCENCKYMRTEERDWKNKTCRHPGRDKRTKSRIVVKGSWKRFKANDREGQNIADPCKLSQEQEKAYSNFCDREKTKKWKQNKWKI